MATYIVVLDTGAVFEVEADKVETVLGGARFWTSGEGAGEWREVALVRDWVLVYEKSHGKRTTLDFE